MTIQAVCVCGAGTMGSGIAQICATAGFHTVLYEVDPAVLARAEASINGSLRTLIAKGKMNEEDAAAILSRITYTGAISACIADLVIEAIVERAGIKTALFTQLAAINHGGTIYASNTSSLSISSLGEAMVNPAQFAGLHFFNPAPLMKLVEVVRGEQTAPEVIETLTAFTASLGKTPVVCRDAPGFIVNRVARPYYIASLRLAEEGVPLQEIDRLLEGRGFRMGPFRLMDLIGNDINYAVSCSVHEQLGRPERLRPSDVQREKVESGKLGRKTGAGYYEYQ
jgi:3-hydroxybutyryl-CoA dehydrogenase